MAKPQSRNQLIDYCLRRLGHPVIEINIDDEQIEDRLDDALQLCAWNTMVMAVQGLLNQ